MSLSPERAAELVPELINELSRNFWNSAVLRAGIKLGVFPLLEDQSLPASAIADHLRANLRFVGRRLGDGVGERPSGLGVSARLRHPVEPFEAIQLHEAGIIEHLA